MAGMSGGVPQSCNLFAQCVFLVLLGFLASSCSSSEYLKYSTTVTERKDTLIPQIPQIPPSEAPQPLLPILAPSGFSPFTNMTVPKLSGLCMLNFEAVESMMSTTAIDCVGSFAPLLANVICCPQVDTALTVLLGQSSKVSNTLALNGTIAKPCLSDFMEILVGQGANDTLHQLCSIHPSNLTEGSCPVKDVTEFERTVNTTSLLLACGKIDTVNECCEQACQNAIIEAAGKLAVKAYDHMGMGMDVSRTLADHSTRVSDCKTIALRWLASKLEPSLAKDVLRGLSNCKLNKVCPLVFPNINQVVKACGTGTSDSFGCCSAMESFLSHLQKQVFVTNLQALNCAASLGQKFQKANITQNLYSMCHTSLKDFSVQVSQTGESGCLLPSLPTDAVFDSSVGLSFLCDLNDNIPAPWPSPTQTHTSSCNKTLNLPALPAAASGQTSIQRLGKSSIAILAISSVLKLVL